MATSYTFVQGWRQECTPRPLDPLEDGEIRNCVFSKALVVPDM
jgi:hypothetical protein